MNLQHKPWTKMMSSSCELMAMDLGFQWLDLCLTMHQQDESRNGAALFEALVRMWSLLK